VIGLTRAAAVAGVWIVARARRRVAAGRPRRFEPVVVTDAGQTGVLVHARTFGVTAGRAIRLVIGLTGAAAVAGVWIVARARRRVAAGRARRFEPVVVTDAGQTGVLIGARGPSIAAGRPVRFVVRLTGAAAVAAVGVVAGAR